MSGDSSICCTKAKRHAETCETYIERSGVAISQEDCSAAIVGKPGSGQWRAIDRTQLWLPGDAVADSPTRDAVHHRAQRVFGEGYRQFTGIGLQVKATF